MLELNKIYNENCLETLSRMPDGFVGYFIFSPPYNMGNTTGGGLRQYSVGRGGSYGKWRGCDQTQARFFAVQAKVKIQEERFGAFFVVGVMER